MDCNGVLWLEICTSILCIVRLLDLVRSSSTLVSSSDPPFRVVYTIVEYNQQIIYAQRPRPNDKLSFRVGFGIGSPYVSRDRMNK